MVIFLEIRIKFFSFPFLRFKSPCKNIEKNSLNKAFKVVLFVIAMKIIKTKFKLKELLYSLSKQKIGFVPTMGALHAGHISLIKASKTRCDITICSIYVNPTQFNSKKDLSNYPSSIKKDVELLKKNHCDILFKPNDFELYEDNLKSNEFDLNNLDKFMEGEYRPGHFQGVATVVTKLFKIINPDIAFFGEKDLQQLVIIKHISNEFDLKIVSVPTVRDKNGLALSSRNKNLTKDSFKSATIIYKSLCYCRDHINKYDIVTLKNKVKKLFERSEFTLEYLEFVSMRTMHPVDFISDDLAICIAATSENVRLIDNIIINARETN